MKFPINIRPANLSELVVLFVSANMMAAYHGWQAQKCGPYSSKGTGAAISQIANEEVELVCAGRTDASVHSSYQVVHFDTRSVEKSQGLGIRC